jgi:hypothetical protein
LIAMAASTAEPPFFNISMPASVPERVGGGRGAVPPEDLGAGAEAGADRTVPRLDVRIMLGPRQSGAERLLRRGGAGEGGGSGGCGKGGEEGASAQAGDSGWTGIEHGP